jgi:hypothetical protein
MAVGEETLRGNQHPGNEFCPAIVADDVNFQYPVSPLRQAGGGRCACANQQKQQQDRGEKKEEVTLQHEYLCNPWPIHMIQKFNVQYVRTIYKQKKEE